MTALFYAFYLVLSGKKFTFVVTIVNFLPEGLLYLRYEESYYYGQDFHRGSAGGRPTQGNDSVL